MQKLNALAPSKLIIISPTNAVPDQKADWQTAGLDLMLIALASARERRETEWRQLLTVPDGSYGTKRIVTKIKYVYH